MESYTDLPQTVFMLLTLPQARNLWDFKGINSGADFPGFNYYPFEGTSMTVADGKIYLQTGDTHGDPLFRGAQLYCVNATSGTEIWSINSFYEGVMPVSDGILMALNGYDNQIYAYGMGPSKTTVTAPSVGVSTSTTNYDKRYSNGHFCRRINNKQLRQTSPTVCPAFLTQA